MAEKFIRYEEMAQHFVAWKNDPQTRWLKQASSQALQQALKNLETAYQCFFDKIAEHPTLGGAASRTVSAFRKASSSTRQTAVASFLS
jgi:transposase